MKKIVKVGIVFFLVLILLTGNIKAYEWGDYNVWQNQNGHLNSVTDLYKRAIIYAVENILNGNQTSETYTVLIKEKRGVFYQNDKMETLFLDMKYPERIMTIVNYEIKDYNGQFDSSYIGSNDINNVNKEDYERIKIEIKRELYERIKTIIDSSDEVYNKELEEKRKEIEEGLEKVPSNDGEYLNRYEAWLRGIIWNDMFDIKVKTEIQEEQGLTEEEMETYTQEFYEVIEGMTKEELENRLKGWEQTLEVLAESSDKEKYKKIETWCKLAEAELEKMETQEKVTEQAKDQYTSYTQPSREEEESTVHSIDEVIKEGKGFLQKGEDDVINGEAVINTSNTIYNIFFGIGIVVAVVVGASIGIKFMVSSVDEKAEIKEILVPYVIGCFIIFGAFGIWKLAMQIVTNLQ